MNWRTFYGKQIPFSKLSHQHLSNIIWYYDLLMGEPPTYQIYIELNVRFGGIKLPYNPLHSFTYEIDALFERGYISDKFESNIIVDGKWVGRLEYK